MERQHFCDECFKTIETYETQYGYLCDECLGKQDEQEEEDRRNDIENYCLSCGCYSEILERFKCPACFEMDGYI